MPTFPSSLETIGYYAFYNCNLMQGQVTLLDSVIYVGEGAFYGCSNITSVELGEGMQHLYSSAFYNCSSISMIRSYAIEPPVVNTNAFYNVPISIPVFVPCGSGPQYVQASGWSTFTWIIASSPYSFDVSTIHSEHGSVTVSQYPSCTNSSATFTAVPSWGYLFSHWSDLNTQNPRTISVTQNTVLRAYFQVRSFQLTATSVNNNYGTVTGGGTYDYYTWATIEAVPQNHYHFLSWNDGVTNNPRYVQVLDDVSYTAFFVPDTHHITVISSDLEQGTATGSGIYAYGTSTVLTATPNTHYHFTQWSDGSTDNPYTVVVTNDANYTAQFAPDIYAVTVSSADYSMGSVNGGGNYAYNTSATLTATADEHYHFTQWSDGSTENPRTVTITSDVSYTAQFAPNVYVILASSTDNDMGAVSGSGNYAYNTVATLTATPNEHYHFTQWSDNNIANPRAVTVTGDSVFTAEFSPNSYSVTVLSSDYTMGTVSGGGSYAYNTSATLTATADEHYHFTQWSDGSTENPRTINVAEDVTFTALFVPNNYMVTVSSANNTMGVVNGGGSYFYNTSATLTATPNPHYHFTQWSDGSTDNPYTVVVTNDANYTAQFAPDIYAVTVSSADYSMGSVNGGGNYAYNTSATLTATADEHYHFTQWSDGSTENPRTVTITSDVSYTAQFAPNVYVILASSTDNDMGAVSGSGNYAYNTVATLTATPNEHYHFTQWSDNNIANPRAVTVTGDSVFTAEFSPNSYSVTVLSSDYTMGTVSGGGSYAYNTSATLTATADEHYHFTQWSDGSTENPRTINVAEDVTFTALFVPNNYMVTVSSANNTMGVVNGGGSYFYNTSATLTATPNPHYHFTQWSDGCTTNPRTIVVTGDTLYTAFFAPDNYLVSGISSDNGMGVVSGGGSYAFNTQATLTATANAQYHFTQWSDGLVDNPRVITVVCDSVFIAQFAPNIYTITVVSSDNTMGEVSGSGNYAYNATAVLIAIANTHYHFSQWSDGNTDNPRVITVANNAIYTALFVPDNYTITVLSSDNDMGSVFGNGNYPYNSTATIAAIPSSHFHFTQWSDGSVDNPRTVMVTGDAAYVAQFAPDNYIVTVNSSDTSMGSVFGSGSYAYNTNVTLTATANQHHHFVQWSDGNTENPRVITVTGNVTYTAMFTEDPIYNIYVTSDNIEMGTVSGGGDFYQGEQAVLVAIPADHYEFSHWSDGNTENPHTITVTENAIYTAYFSIMTYQVNVSSSDSEAGYVTGNGVYEYGTQVTVAAFPYDGHTFVGWSDGTMENPYTFTVASDVSLEAFFSGNGLEEVTLCSIIIRVVNNHIFIENAEGQDASLFDMSGRLLAISADASTGFDVSTTGVYLLKIGTHYVTKVLVR